MELHKEKLVIIKINYQKYTCVTQAPVTLTQHTECHSNLPNCVSLPMSDNLTYSQTTPKLTPPVYTRVRNHTCPTAAIPVLFNLLFNSSITANSLPLSEFINFV